MRRVPVTDRGSVSRRSILRGGLAAGGLGLAGALSGCGSPLAAGLAGTELSPGTLTFWNLFGGGDGAQAASEIIRADGTREAIPSKVVTRLMKGDRVVLQTAGGAGYGDPALRSPEAATADRADGKV